MDGYSRVQVNHREPGTERPPQEQKSADKNGGTGGYSGKEIKNSDDANRTADKIRRVVPSQIYYPGNCPDDPIGKT